MNQDQIWILILVSFFCGLGGTWVARLFALKFHIVNQPNKIVPQHTKSIAYLGGLGIFVGLATTLVIGHVTQTYILAFPEIRSLWIPSSTFLILGLYDDLNPLSPLPKIILQSGASVLAILCGNILQIFDIYWLDAGLTFFCLVLVINAFNFTDVCDGLVAGLSVIALVFAGFLYPDKQIISLLMMGNCLGFWIFNKPPATIFLGDAGSHVLGFWCIYILIRPFQDWSDGIQNILILGVPIFELIFITIVRINKKLPWWKGSPDHFSLRLQAAGYSKYKTNFLTYITASLLGIIALLLPVLHTTSQYLFLIAVCISAGFIWKWLLRLDTSK